MAALDRLAGAGPSRAGMLSAVPVSNAEQHGHRQQCGRREPGNARLALRDHDKGGEDRPQRGADVAADLEQGLGQTVPSARGQARDSRSFGVKDSGADADQRRRQHQDRVATSAGQQEQRTQQCSPRQLWRRCTFSGAAIT